MTRWIVVWLVAAVSLPGWGQPNSQPQLQPQVQPQSRSRIALTTNQVAQAICARGVDITDVQVSLLANVVATEPDPALDILAVQPLGDRRSTGRTETRSMVKLACHVSSVCLPFYAIVSRRIDLVPNAKRGPGAPALANSMLNPDRAVTMRAGTHATLVMDDDRSHIQVAVVSLENGIAGHRIRVASPDHKQFYVAEVINEHMLKRSF